MEDRKRITAFDELQPGDLIEIWDREKWVGVYLGRSNYWRDPTGSYPEIGLFLADGRIAGFDLVEEDVWVLS